MPWSCQRLAFFGSFASTFANAAFARSGSLPLTYSRISPLCAARFFGSRSSARWYISRACSRSRSASAGVRFGSAASWTRTSPRDTRVSGFSFDACGIGSSAAIFAADRARDSSSTSERPASHFEGDEQPRAPAHTAPRIHRVQRQSIVYPARQKGSGLPGPASELGDETRRGLGHQRARQVDGLFPVSANRLHRLQQIAAVAGPRRPALIVIPVVQVLDRLRARVHAQPLAHRREDPLVHVAGRRVHLHL